MSGLLGKPPKAEPVVQVDPADTQNRLGAQRTRRLAQGGSTSTIFGQAMSSGTSAPRATLTGMG